MSEEMFYRCIPELNKECKKNNCYINGGECEMTICKKYSLKGLLEEIERLKEQLNDEIDDELKQSEIMVKQQNEIERLNNIINELSEKNRNLIEDNMRLRKELNLHGGKLYISDIEVKKVWK